MTANEDIFISYRRNIDGEAAARLTRELRDFFGESKVFLDVTSLTPDAQYPQRLRDAVSDAKVILPIISPKWVKELKERDGSPCRGR
jgi:hypothetical protein